MVVITFINESGGGLVSKTVSHVNEYPHVSVLGQLVNTDKLRLAGFWFTLRCGSRVDTRAPWHYQCDLLLFGRYSPARRIEHLCSNLPSWPVSCILGLAVN